MVTASRSRMTIIRNFADSLGPCGCSAEKWIVELAIRGSGVGACIAANKVPGVRACLIHESFSAPPGC